MLAREIIEQYQKSPELIAELHRRYNALLKRLRLAQSYLDSEADHKEKDRKFIVCVAEIQVPMCLYLDLLEAYGEKACDDEIKNGFEGA